MDRQRGNQAPRVEVEEVRLFLVWVDLDVAVRDGVRVQDEPDALDEGAEPAAVEGEVLRGGGI